MNDSRPQPDPVLATFRSEILRWNRQINLVSRRDTPRTVDDLVRQCQDACAVLLAHERAAGRDLLAQALLYCDLGSGAGLPGFVWHRRLRGETARLQSWLIEPREKRAWFLRRVARHLGPETYGVGVGRWGEVMAPVPVVAAGALVSLKALRLRDLDVLAGLETFCASGAATPRTVVIARFHPEGEAWSQELAAALGIQPRGEASGRWEGCGAEVVPVASEQGEATSLVISRYSRRNSP